MTREETEWKGNTRKENIHRYEGRFFNKAHYTVLQNSTLVELYIEEHMEFVRSKNPGRNEAWIMRHHMETFGYWLQKMPG